MSKNIFFISTEHQQRLFTAISQIRKIYGGKLDPEYASALYLLTSDKWTWNKASAYVSNHGIAFDDLLEEIDFSSGYLVLIKLAGNLFNNQQHIDPLEFLRLDECNFHLALTAILLRRTGLSVEDFDAPVTNGLSLKSKVI